MKKTADELTKAQIDLARHALGLNYSKKSFRNHFVASAGSNDHKEWDDMVIRGFANVSRNHHLSGNGDCFWLTKEGAKLVLRKSEQLCKEDFPNEKNSR